MPTYGFASFSLMDYDREIGTVRFRIPEITLVNFEAVTGEIAALRNAMCILPVAMSAGTLVKSAYGNETISEPIPPDNANYQRELKYLVSFHDDTTFQKGSFEIPVANTDRLDPNDRKHAEIGDAGDVDAFITALEALALTNAGNAMVVDEITLVGRRL